MKPLCIDLYAGLGGWSEAFLANGYECVGFDIERHEYWMPEAPTGDDSGSKNTKAISNRGWTQGCAITMGIEGKGQLPRTRLARYPGQLVIQDCLTLHGSQFKDATVIVSSPPCQKYSWLAMPWSRSANPENSKAAKALRGEWEANGPDNRLFDTCFRIQREACEAAGRHIPLIVENVRGAQPWVGRAVWNYGSFFLWGDVPALMPINFKKCGRKKHEVPEWKTLVSGLQYSNGQRYDYDGQKNSGGTKVGGDWFSDPQSTCRKHSSRSSARKAASAQIAKIPFALADHVARTFLPAGEAVA